MYKKKQRGQLKKLNRLMKYLIADTRVFPIHDGKYDHWHLPCAESFINNPKTSPKIKIQVIQCMIDCAQHLFNIKPNMAQFCRVICMISTPDIWNSQIIIFFDEDNFNNFFKRDDFNFKWEVLTNKSFKIDKKLRMSNQFAEVGYLEKIQDGNGKLYQNELWFYGELKPINS